MRAALCATSGTWRHRSGVGRCGCQDLAVERRVFMHSEFKCELAIWHETRAEHIDTFLH